MDIFIEVISVFWQAFWGFLSAIGSAIWQNLPQLLELKKIMGYFTPIGAVALYIGVPSVLLTAFVWLFRTATKN